MLTSLAIGRLSPQQQKALSLMLQGQSNTKIADKLGVTRVTISRWANRPEFQQALAEQIAAVQGAVNAEIREAQLQAVDVILDLLRDCDASEAARFNAARYVLDKFEAQSLPTVVGIPQSVAIEALLSVSSAYEAAMQGAIAALYEILGLCSEAEYEAATTRDRALLAVGCEVLAAELRGGLWRPQQNDPVLRFWLMYSNQNQSNQNHASEETDTTD